MSRRRHDYRTWDELTRQERQRGLTVLGVTGAGVITAVVLVMGGSGASGAAGAAAPPTIDVTARLSSWYATTAELRAGIVEAVDEVRADIAKADGASLQPACLELGQEVDKIAPLGLPPVATASRTWTDGADAYRSAVTSCGNLFDGTPAAPPVLLQRTTDALDTADGHWSRLAAEIGAPAQILPAP